MPSNPIPYFGRAWNIEVDTSDGNTYSLTSEVASGRDPLRVQFSIEMYMLSVYWGAHVTVYNAAGPVMNQIRADDPDMWQLDKPLILGDQVRISAGYRASDGERFNPNANLIYSGRVMQSWLVRENVVDYKFTMRLMTGFVEDALNPLNLSVPAKLSDYEKLQQIVNPANTNIQIENVDETARKLLDANKYSRGQVFRETVSTAVQNMCDQHGLFAWLSPDGLNVRSFDADLPDPTVIYGPPFLNNYGNSQVVYEATGGSGNQAPIKPTLIGTPQETQQGIMFRVLLDSDVKIGQVIQIAGQTLENAFPFQYNSQRPRRPNPSGIYVVAGIRHVGDSRGRGDDWFTEITGFSADFFSNYINSNSIWAAERKKLKQPNQ